MLQTSSQSEVNTQSYGAPNLRESQLWEFRDSHLGVVGQKCHLNVAPVETRKIYCKGEGGGFPQFRTMVNLVSLSLPIACPSTKSARTMH